jgi:hypothetical protein
MRTVKPARPQQLQAVLRTPGGTAVVVFGILKMVLQEKSSLKARFFVKPAATTKPGARTDTFLWSAIGPKK